MKSDIEKNIRKTPCHLCELLWCLQYSGKHRLNRKHTIGQIYYERKQMNWIKEMYQNKNLYLLIMVALLLTITVLDSFELSSLVIRVLLITFYVLLILRYQFLRYPVVFLIIIALLFLTSVFQQKFIILLDQYSGNYLINLYLLNGGTNISMILILALFIYSFIAQQRLKNKKLWINKLDSLTIWKLNNFRT